MWSALTPGRKMRATAIAARTYAAVEGRVVGAEVAADPRLDARLAVPGERPEVVADRMHGNLAGDGADAAADDHRGNVELAPLQPLRRAHIVAVGPGSDAGPIGIHGSDRRTTISWRNASKTMAPAKASSEVSAVMTFASLRSGWPERSSRSRATTLGGSRGARGRRWRSACGEARRAACRAPPSGCRCRS